MRCDYNAKYWQEIIKTAKNRGKIAHQNISILLLDSTRMHISMTMFQNFPGVHAPGPS